MKKFIKKIEDNLPVTIVCLGDSITYGYQPFTGAQVEEPYPDILQNIISNSHVINSGFSGYKTTNIINIIDDTVLKFRPDLCIIMLGINDARGSKKGLTVFTNQYLRNIKQIMETLEKNDIEYLVLTPTPVKNIRTNYFYNILVEFLEQNNIDYIDIHQHFKLLVTEINCNHADLFPDGVHLRDDLYCLIAKDVANNIKKNLRK